MSVAFTAELVPAEAFAASCGCERATALARSYPSFEQAHDAAEAANSGPRSALPGCDMPEVCPDYPLYAREVCGDPAPLVDLHNANAVRVLDLLGLPAAPAPETPGAQADQAASGPGEQDPDEGVVLEFVLLDAYGLMEADAFLGRVLMALALTPADAGVDGFWRGRSYTGGRPAGHLQRTLERLHELALWCRIRGRQVQWS